MYSQMFYSNIEIDVTEASDGTYREGIGYIYYYCSISINNDQQYGTYGISSLSPNEVMCDINAFVYAVAFRDYFGRKDFAL
jgi:hypothetical protein